MSKQENQDQQKSITRESTEDSLSEASTPDGGLRTITQIKATNLESYYDEGLHEEIVAASQKFEEVISLLNNGCITLENSVKALLPLTSLIGQKGMIQDEYKELSFRVNATIDGLVELSTRREALFEELYELIDTLPDEIYIDTAEALSNDLAHSFEDTIGRHNENIFKGIFNTATLRSDITSILEELWQCSLKIEPEDIDPNLDRKQVAHELRERPSSVVDWRDFSNGECGLEGRDNGDECLRIVDKLYFYSRDLSALAKQALEIHNTTRDFGAPHIMVTYSGEDVPAEVFEQIRIFKENSSPIMEESEPHLSDYVTVLKDETSVKGVIQWDHTVSVTEDEFEDEITSTTIQVNDLSLESSITNDMPAVLTAFKAEILHSGAESITFNTNSTSEKQSESATEIKTVPTAGPSSQSFFERVADRSARIERTQALSSLFDKINSLEQENGNYLRAITDKLSALERHQETKQIAAEIRKDYTSSLAQIVDTHGALHSHFERLLSNQELYCGLTQVPLIPDCSQELAAFHESIKDWHTDNGAVDAAVDSSMRLFSKIQDELSGYQSDPELLNIPLSFETVRVEVASQQNPYTSYEFAELLSVWANYHGLNYTNQPEGTWYLNHLRSEKLHSNYEFGGTLGPEIYKGRAFKDYSRVAQVGATTCDLLLMQERLKGLDLRLEALCEKYSLSRVTTVVRRADEIDPDDPIFEEIVELERPLYKAPGDPSIGETGVVLGLAEKEDNQELRDEGARFVTVHENGVLQGYCIYFTEAPDWGHGSLPGSDETTGYIVMLNATPEIGALGGAGALFDAVVGDLAFTSTKSLIAQVEHSNARAMNFWQKKGWTIQGELTQEKAGKGTVSGEVGHFIEMYYYVDPNRTDDPNPKSVYEKQVSAIESEIAIRRYYVTNKTSDESPEIRARLAAKCIKPEGGPRLALHGFDISIFKTEGLDALNPQVYLTASDSPNNVVKYPSMVDAVTMIVGIGQESVKTQAGQIVCIEPKGVHPLHHFGVERLERCEMLQSARELDGAPSILLIGDNASIRESVVDAGYWLEAGLPVILTGATAKEIENSLAKGVLNSHIDFKNVGPLILADAGESSLKEVLDKVGRGEDLPKEYYSNALQEGLLHVRFGEFTFLESYPDLNTFSEGKVLPPDMKVPEQPKDRTLSLQLKTLDRAAFLLSRVIVEEQDKHLEIKTSRGELLKSVNQKQTFQNRLRERDGQIVFRSVTRPVLRGHISQTIRTDTIITPSEFDPEVLMRRQACLGLGAYMGIEFDFKRIFDMQGVHPPPPGTMRFSFNSSGRPTCDYYRGVIGSINPRAFLGFLQDIPEDQLIDPAFLERSLNVSPGLVKLNDPQHGLLRAQVLLNEVIHELQEYCTGVSKQKSERLLPGRAYVSPEDEQKSAEDLDHYSNKLAEMFASPMPSIKEKEGPHISRLSTKVTVNEKLPLEELKTRGVYELLELLHALPEIEREHLTGKIPAMKYLFEAADDILGAKF